MIEFDVNGKKYRLRNLTADELRRADLLYSKVLHQALREGVMTNKEMINLMTERGQWTQEDEENINRFQKETLMLEEKLIKSATNKKKEEIAMNLKTTRAMLNLLRGRQIELLNNTAESMAEIEKANWIAFKCLVDGDNNQVYEDYDEFVNSTDPVRFEVLKQVLYRNAGLDPSHALPEDDVLKKVGRMNEDGFLIDKEGRIVDEFGNLIDKVYRRVDKEGYLVNESGKHIDENGHIVSKEAKVKGIF